MRAENKKQYVVNVKRKKEASRRPTIADAMSRIDAVEAKIDRLIERTAPVPSQVQIREYLRAGDIYTDSDNAHVILVLDSCTRTRRGLVHKWTHIQHFGQIGAGKVCEDAEDLIARNNMYLVGSIKDFLNIDLPYKRRVCE